MTDNFKCPFCGEELERCSYLSKGITNPVFVCRNRKCKFVDKIIDSEIWQALIDGKKAQNAIQKIKDIVYPALDREFYSELRDDMLAIGRIIVSVEKQE